MRSAHNIKGTSDSTLRAKKTLSAKIEIADQKPVRKYTRRKKHECPFEGCIARIRTDLGMRLHLARMHGIEFKKGASIKLPELIAQIKATMGPPMGPFTSEIPKVAVQESQTPTQLSVLGVSSCPSCGCNLEAYNMLYATLQGGDINMKALKLALERVASVSKVHV
jgi:hypothetical protein